MSGQKLNYEVKKAFLNNFLLLNTIKEVTLANALLHKPDT